MCIDHRLLVITFQSTRPRGRTRLDGNRAYITSDTFQSTRPRGRTRQDDTMLDKRLSVSIHASSREDATRKIQKLPNRCLFQSTRPRGRTRQCRNRLNLHKLSFNPRVLAGGRDNDTLPSVLGNRVSIHASSREDATVSVESNINQNVTFAKARRK